MNEKGEIRIKEAKSRLPVDVRGSKTSVLKLPNNVNVLSLLDFDECSTSTPVCVVNAVSWNGGKFEIREDKKIDSKRVHASGMYQKWKSFISLQLYRVSKCFSLPSKQNTCSRLLRLDFIYPYIRSTL